MKIVFYKENTQITVNYYTINYIILWQNLKWNNVKTCFCNCYSAMELKTKWCYEARIVKLIKIDLKFLKWVF